mgnify:CR=1 FL=1
MAADNFEALLEYAFANCPKGEENSWAYNASCSALAEELCTEAGNAAQLLSGGYENILEINGHYGAFTAVLAKKCRRLVTADKSEACRRLIKLRCPEAEVTGDIPDEKFDLIWINGADDKLESSPAEMFRSLKNRLTDHGGMIMLLPNGKGSGGGGGGGGWGVFCMLLATVIFTLSGPWNKSVTKKADSFAVCFLNLFVGGAALFVLGTALGGRLGSVTPLGVLVLLYLAFICGAGYLLWALLMKNNPVSRIAIFGFVNPVVNVLLSAVLNGEPLFRWQYLAALVFVCVGIWLVNKAPAKKEAP